MKCEHCSKELRGYKVDISETRSVSERIYLHSGNHPKLQRANKLIEEARELERELDEIQQQERKKLKASYRREVTVHVRDDKRWHSKIPEGTEYIAITSTLQNKSDYEDHMREFGSIMGGTPDERTTSVNYYRKHGFLLHEGGGWLVLEDEQPCSDEEWELLKKGEFPEKFTKGAKA